MLPIMDQPLPRVRPADRSGSGRRLVLAACMMATFMAAVESTIVATAMPSIVAELGGFNLLSWVFSAYLLAQAVTIPIYGRLADLYGRKRVFFIGAGLFLAGSTLSGFAPSMSILVGCRVLQGFGAGAVQPIAYTIVGDIYTPSERARIQGMLSGVFGIAALIGPPLGAFLVEQVDWRLVFWINLPIGAAAIAMIAALFHERHRARPHVIDFGGAALLVMGVAALVFAAGQGQVLGAAAVVGLLFAGAAALGALALWERRAAEPILPLRLLTDRVIVIGSLGGGTIGAVMMSVTVFLPTYVQAVMGRTPMVAGIVLSTMSVAWTLASIAAGRMMVRTSYRRTAILGAVTLLIGAGLLIGMVPGSGPLWAGAGALAIGMGMGFCNTTFIVSVQGHVPWAERGSATAAQMCMRMIGQSLGAAISGSVLSLGLPGEAANAVDRLLNLSARAAMSPAELHSLIHAVAGSLRNVYLLSATLALATLVLVLRLPVAFSPRHQGHER
ncbi:MAG TPA: MDR family MFS transporter [Acetobacteraceae bacterium]